MELGGKQTMSRRHFPPPIGSHLILFRYRRQCHHIGGGGAVGKKPGSSSYKDQEQGRTTESLVDNKADFHCLVRNNRG